ncbi:MAG TPA: DMT family transporter [Polaromonas sp.]|uniref:DMT family transporter n=1 Tax=Polaromonas sp. TaxID=1869339 RepID=UPI002D625DEF|nr:DMT family transporter [Polaromonas sp.]HYW57010.1 DMT family transporter [Polaromonas sp.]
MTQRALLLAAGALVVNALIWGLSWWPFRELHSLGLHPLWATALIFVFSLACITVWRPGGWAVFTKHPLLWLLAAGAGFTNVGFNWAVTVGDVVRVVLLFYLMPAWSVLLAWAVLGEKPTRMSLLRLLLAMTGVIIVLKSPDSPWPVPKDIADWLALMGGFSFAVTNVLLRKLQYTPSEARMIAMFGGGALTASGTAWLGMTLSAVPAPLWSLSWIWLALGLGLAFLISNMALQYGAARLAASTTAIVMLTEILFASLSAVALGAAELSSRTLLGGGLIVLAAALAALAPPSK